MDILSSISFVITGNGIDIPKEFSGKPVKRIDETDISGFMSSVMNVQKTGNILVITNNEPVAELVRAINHNIKQNKISVMCKGKLDTSALEEEITAKSLHTADGKTFIPEPVEDYPCLMHTDSRLILKRQPRNDEEAVFNKDNEAVGVLLENSLKYENIAGTADKHSDILSIPEKAFLMLKMLKERCSDTVSLSDVLMVRIGKGYGFIVLPSENTKNICSTELELFTGLTAEKNTFCEVIQRLADISLPDVISEDIGRIVTNLFISAKTPVPDYRLIANTMQRILITEELR